ncbi:hypothetical protein [Streptosporangium sp. NBC_01756]|uniref:hypothetical protein n=1 Tax=Streptosporangium sp. NBC_01756 TaxID=2975950 RepID=UPI002DDAFE75|nr:hypothetical protein [Streptosporangium sp. NBC_01756]WSC83906.1 hypothetical protein OIE48_26345 [Streptosporangium sp. NBC_01756]
MDATLCSARVIHFLLSRKRAELREEAERRFRRVARATARIRHPELPVVYDNGRQDDQGLAA